MATTRQNSVASAAVAPADHALTGLRPLQTSAPVLLMSAPFSLDTVEPNNQSMRDLDAHARAIDPIRADHDFLELYRAVASEALVYLLPSTPGLQDQVYVSNLLVVPAHASNGAVISNFASPPRWGEAMPGRAFLAQLGFDVIQAPKYFEGEADLKHLRDNAYVGAWGSRTTRQALEWFARRFDALVIPYRLTNPYLYHLDCVVMPVSRDTCVVCTECCDAETTRALGEIVDIIPVDQELALAGITNSIVLPKRIIAGSRISVLKRSDAAYAIESRKISILESLCELTARELVIHHVGEFAKSGAALSCLVATLSAPEPSEAGGLEAVSGAQRK